MAIRVRSYETGEVLEGVPSRMLLVELEAKREAGEQPVVVAACRDLGGTWRFVESVDQERMLERGMEVVPVFVDEAP